MNFRWTGRNPTCRMERKEPQRGTAATECTARDEWAGCKNTAVSCRAERGDFVAHGEDGVGPVTEQFDGKIRERSANQRLLRRFSDIVRQNAGFVAMCLVLFLCACHELRSQLAVPVVIEDSTVRATASYGEQPVIVSVSPSPGPLTRLTSITVVFSEPVTGVDAKDLRVNDIPATDLVGTGDTYTFMFPQPAMGIIQISWDMNCGIADLATPPNQFNPTGATARWMYELYDPTPPVVAVLNPPADQQVRQLTQIEVVFNKAVVGVDAADLIINGRPANSVSGTAAGPYVFLFDAQPGGLATVRWAANHGITDCTPAGSLFGGGSWSYQVDPARPVPLVMINEIMAENATGLKDEDGDAEDWIELHNGWTNDVWLAGWSLSDDPQNPGKWVFPNVTLGAGKFMVVFASGKDRKPTTIGSRLHTNFKLGISGEYLGLFMPESPRLAVSELAPRFPEQRIDISYGRDAAGEWRYYARGSPGLANGTSAISNAVSPVHFSVRRGFFAKPFLLSLATETPGAQIVFTMDGSVPSLTNGVVYTNPVMITSTRIVRAAAFRTNWLPSKVETHTYLYGLPQARRALPALSIVTASNNLYGPKGIMEYNPRNTIYHGIAWERPVSVEWINPLDNSGFQVDCGLRVHGGGYIRERYNYRSGSLPESKYSFRLYFRGDYGPGRLEQPIFPEVPAESFDTIVLRAGMNDHSNPFLRDEFARRLEVDVGQVSARGTFVHLFLNGAYKGYYNPTERIGVDFLKTYHGGGDKWDIIAGPSEVVEGDNSAWRQLITYATSFNLNIAERYQEIERRLDTTNFVEYLLPLIYADTDDWPHNNWRAAREKVAGGLFRFYAWDAEWSFGFNNSPSHSTIANQLSSLSPPWGGTDIQRLFRALTNSYEFRLLFADRVHRHFFNDGALTDGRIRARYDWLKSQIAPAISGFNDSIGTSWIAQRRRYLTNHFAQAGLLASSNAPVFSLHGGRVPRGFALTMRAGLGDIYYTMDGSDPRTRFTSAVAPGAILYSSAAPVVLESSAIVRARTRWGTNWSAVTEAVFQVQDFGLPLRIVEVMYHPPGDEPYEFIELENVSAVPIDISNVSLDGVTFRFLQSTVLPGRGRVLLASDANPAAFHSRYPGVTVHGYFKGSLSNSGEKLSLLDSAGRVVESVQYKDSGGWPTEADGGGYSLEIINPNGDPSDPANWRASVNQGGSPGAPNPVVPTPELRLNEIFVCGDGFSGGGSSSEGWIEIFNSGGVPQDMGGWRLRNADGTKQYVFPPMTVGAKEYVLVRLGSDPATNQLNAGFGCDCSGESLFLEGPQGKRIDAVSFGQQARGYSIGRFGEESEWQLAEPTPGAANKAALLASQANLVVNELLANAVQGGTDWIELFNRDDHAPVALRGLSLATSNALFQVTSLLFCGPRGHVLLIADEQPGPAHVNFKLPAARGFVALYDPLGNQLDRMAYTNAVEGVSLGRLPDGAATIRAFPGTASPGGPNYALPVGGLRINEIMAVNRVSVTNAQGRCADWIELFNPAETEADLSGMSLSADVMEGAGYHFPVGIKVAPHGYLVVWCDDEAPVSVEPGAVLNSGLRLRGEGGSVFLHDGLGGLIDMVTYGFQHPEMSIGRAGSDWALLAVPTPGGANSGVADLGDPGVVRINEWMASGQGDDWLELHNPGPLPVNLGGLVLTDDPSLPGQTNHVIAPLTFISGPGWIAYKADGNVGQGPDHLPFKLDALGETIRLYSKNYSIIDEVNLLVQERGVSEGRFPDGSTNIARLRSRSSPSGPNFLVNDTVVINEIMYHPVSNSDSGAFENVGEEYIELHNMSGVDVPLFDLEHPANTWRVTGGIEFCFPTNTWLGPRSFLIVVPFDPSTDAVARASFVNKYQISSQTKLVGPWRGKLSNEGEALELMKPGQPQVSVNSGSTYVPWIPIDRVCYSGHAPWPVAANGTGFSLQRIVASAYGNAPGHWCAMAPTPGAVNIAESLDSDRDGLPDVWELLHGLNPFAGAGQDGPDGDPDRDGLTNMQEYMARTEPRSATLLILNFLMGESEIRFTCNTIAGVGLVVESCEGLETAVWSAVEELPAPENTGTRTFSVPIDDRSDTRFFRLRIRDSAPR